MRTAVCVTSLLATAAAGAAEEAPSPFAGGIGNMIVTLIIFGIVVFVLGKYAWPVLLKTLAEREQAIRKALEEARHEREEAARLLEQYRKQLDEARQQASAIVEEGRRDAEVVRRRLHEQAQQEAEQILARARQEIELATEAAKRELFDRVADLAVMIAGRILRRELKPEDHRDLVVQSVQQIESHNGNGQTG